MALPEEVYQKYRSYMVNEFEGRLKKRNEQKRRLELDKSKTERKLKDYIVKYMGALKDEIEQEIYDKEKNRLSMLISSIQADIDQIQSNERNDILESEALF